MVPSSPMTNERPIPSDVSAWRQDIHANPELLYDVRRTAKLVEEKLKAFGCDEVTPGIAKTGVVGVIKGRETTSGRVVALRADMDALPIVEQTQLPYASTIEGKMHACGHDGHTAMLLGAARDLCQSRAFNGTAIVIFQPAEEGGAGARAMIRDGLMDRWGIQEVYGLHNLPGLEIGKFAICPGPIMAASDTVSITVAGRGGHAAKPNECIDPVLVGAHIIVALQSIVARNLDPMDQAVISMCAIEGGKAFNVIPPEIKMIGTARALRAEVRDMLQVRIKEVAEGTARAFGAEARVKYRKGYPVTFNHARETQFAADVARDVVGPDNVDDQALPVLGAEDFSFMLNERPGAFIFLGNGPSAGLHQPDYDFSDAAIPYGIGYWSRLIERAMAANGG